MMLQILRVALTLIVLGVIQLNYTIQYAHLQLSEIRLDTTVAPNDILLLLVCLNYPTEELPLPLLVDARNLMLN
jgi:type III secretory pathway component EscU